MGLLWPALMYLESRATQWLINRYISDSSKQILARATNGEFGVHQNAPTALEHVNRLIGAIKVLTDVERTVRTKSTLAM